MIATAGTTTSATPSPLTPLTSSRSEGDLNEMLTLQGFLQVISCRTQSTQKPCLGSSLARLHADAAAVQGGRRRCWAQALSEPKEWPLDDIV